jgi:hypothetical protein
MIQDGSQRTSCDTPVQVLQWPGPCTLASSGLPWRRCPSRPGWRAAAAAHPGRAPGSSADNRHLFKLKLSGLKKEYIPYVNKMDGTLKNSGAMKKS